MTGANASSRPSVKSTPQREARKKEHSQMSSIAHAILITTISLPIVQAAAGDMASPPWPSADHATASALVNGTAYGPIDVPINQNFDFEHSFPSPTSEQQVYTKINVDNAPQTGSNYYTNFTGYYETYGPAGDYQATWEIDGSYDFNGLQNHYLQFGVNTNPVSPLVIPLGEGDIEFTLSVNGNPVDNPWKFYHDDSGRNLWHASQDDIGSTGTFTLQIVFNGVTGSNLNPQARFDAWLGVVETLEIPAPGVMALLGLGAIASRRRRA